MFHPTLQANAPSMYFHLILFRLGYSSKWILYFFHASAALLSAQTQSNLYSSHLHMWPTSRKAAQSLIMWPCPFALLPADSPAQLVCCLLMAGKLLQGDIIRYSSSKRLVDLSCIKESLTVMHYWKLFLKSQQTSSFSSEGGLDSFHGTHPLIANIMPLNFISRPQWNLFYLQ